MVWRQALAARADRKRVVDGPAKLAGSLARADTLAQRPGERRFNKLAIQVIKSA